MDRAVLRLVAVGSLALMTVDVMSEVTLTAGDARPPSMRLVLVLLALAGLCVAGLATPRAPAIAGFALAWAGGLASIDALGVARSADATTLAVGVRSAMALVALGLPLATEARVLRHRGRAAKVGPVLVTLATLGVAAWAFLAPGRTSGGTGPSAVIGLLPADPASLANRVLLVDVLALVLVAALLELGPRWRDAERRLVEERSAAGSAAPTLGGGSGSALADRVRRARDVLTIIWAEGLPGSVRRQRAAAELERRRLASDLHAAVLPELRVALAAAQASNAPATVRHQVQVAVDEVEQLMAARQPVVVDALGLVAGLEWLAERVQARYGIAVALELPDAAPAESAVEQRLHPDRSASTGHSRGLPPEPVQRAAFRVAQLALDNAGRHSGATEVTMTLSMTAASMRLVIEDAGPSREDPVAVPDRALSSDPAVVGRGLRDMRDEAVAIGASLEVVRGRGTRVELSWPRPTA